MVVLMNSEDWEEMEKSETEKVKGKDKKVCACGRVVCCGKHKNCQCSYKKEGKERDQFLKGGESNWFGFTDLQQEMSHHRTTKLLRGNPNEPKKHDC